MRQEYEEIILDLQNFIRENWTDETKNEFYLSGIKNDDLIRYHNSFGCFIRNKYNLWSIPWEPEIRDGIDYSPYHPDEVSFTIINELWRRGVPR